METLMRIHSSARPFMNGIHQEIARHLRYDGASEEKEEDMIIELEDESIIGQLPLEIRHTICSFMSSVDLCHVSQVSRVWNILCNEEVHWKSAFDGEKTNWDSIQCYKPSATVWEKFAKASNVWAEEGDSSPQQTRFVPKWKTTLMINRREHNNNTKNKNKQMEPLPSLPSLSSFSESNLGEMANAIKANAPFLASKLASKIKVPFKKTYRIPMLGEGLESTSKDLLYSMMWPQNPVFSVTGLYPGIEGIGSGVGFSINNVDMNIAALHRCSLDEMNVKWQSYFKKSDGAIYVVSCKNLDNKPMRKQLKLIVSGENPLIPSKAPLLVLLVSDDIASESIRPSEMMQELGLEKLDRAWCIQFVHMGTLEGLPEGLRWLASKL